MSNLGRGRVPDHVRDRLAEGYITPEDAEVLRDRQERLEEANKELRRILESKDEELLKLRSENHHLASKLRMVEDQLNEMDRRRRIRESPFDVAPSTTIGSPDTYDREKLQKLWQDIASNSKADIEKVVEELRKYPVREAPGDTGRLAGSYSRQGGKTTSIQEQLREMGI